MLDVTAGEDLATIFRRYGTDKAANGYAPVYECLFRGRARHDVQTVLEVGIGTLHPEAHSTMRGFALAGYQPGGSLRAWRDFFPDATIYGIDTQSDTQLQGEERIVTGLANSTDRTQVDAFMEANDHPMFDVIIDDGSHIATDQLATLGNLFCRLADGGVYVIEDVVLGGLYHFRDKIAEICGGSPFFFVGPGNNPLVISRRSV